MFNSSYLPAMNAAQRVPFVSRFPEQYSNEQGFRQSLWLANNQKANEQHKANPSFAEVMHEIEHAHSQIA